MKKFMFLAASAALMGTMFSSCSQDDSVEMGSTKENKIKFSAIQDNALGRGTAITGANYLNTTLVPGMKVWGYFTKGVTEGNGIVAGAQYVGTDGDGIFIDNASTFANETWTGAWDYRTPSDIAFWPSQNLNFYAIMPTDDDASITSVTGTVSDLLGHVVATVEVPTTVADQKDIMFAKALNEAPRTADANTPVNFQFSHAMSQIIFHGKLASTNITAEVESITIANIDQKGKVGYLTSNGAKTDVVLGSQLADTRVYAKYALGLVDDTEMNADNAVEEAMNLTAADGALMMLPQNRTADKWATVIGTPVSIADADLNANHQVYLAVSCKVQNGSVYVIGTESTYETIYIPFDANWEQGKKYTYTLVFGTGSGAFDEDGNPLDSMLPIYYTVSAPEEWTAVDGGEYNS